MLEKSISRGINLDALNISSDTSIISASIDIEIDETSPSVLEGQLVSSNVSLQRKDSLQIPRLQSPL